MHHGLRGMDAPVVRRRSRDRAYLVIPTRCNRKYREQERGQAENFAIRESMIING